MLSKDEQSIYKRQLNISGWNEEKQQKLKRSTVFVAGAGGLGSPLLFYLTAAGVGTIRICDFDKIEMSNLNRQILHSLDGIGMLKVDSAYKRLSTLNKNVTITRLSERMTERNAEDFVGASDIIVDCLDNFATRHLLNRISVRKRIPMVHAGISELQGHLTFLNPPETPCLACFISEDRPSETLNVLGATAGTMGTLQAMETIKYLTGVGQNSKSKLIIYNGFSMSFDSMTLSKDLDCKVCGKSTSER